jgi:glutathione synthase/RimK-type ligase-like ATP-grasp enzyme
MKSIRVAIGQDNLGWHEKFAASLAKKAGLGYPVEYNLVNLDSHSWIQNVESSDVVIWHPHYMGIKKSSHFREKIYFLENHLGKVVVPNYNSVWHFESKIAQSYIFAAYGIKIPCTTVSFDYWDAIEQIQRTEMPLVFKESHGAGSHNVWLIKKRRHALQYLKRIFCGQIWHKSTITHNSIVHATLVSLIRPWFWQKLIHKLLGKESNEASYWQEFIPGNEADLRITVIGDRYAFGFWRNNRSNDFRASGSGLIDYKRAIPEEQLRYCLQVNKKLRFDTMAYDVLFSNDDFVINEISYGYLDTAIYKASGYYYLTNNGNIEFREGHIWPQELWVEWALSRAECELSQ